MTKVYGVFEINKVKPVFTSHNKKPIKKFIKKLKETKDNHAKFEFSKNLSIDFLNHRPEEPKIIHTKLLNKLIRERIIRHKKEHKICSIMRDKKFILRTIGDEMIIARCKNDQCILKEVCIPVNEYK
jgi:hypothetical protein